MILTANMATSGKGINLTLKVANVNLRIYVGAITITTLAKGNAEAHTEVTLPTYCTTPDPLLAVLTQSVCGV